VAENSERAFLLTRQLLPEIILMDVNVPDMDGTEATNRPLAEIPDIKIVALSMQAENGFMAGVIRAGEVGYTLKGGDSEELYGIIRRNAGYRKT